jgi:phosphohistidine swiveling domain-containing protein
LDRAKNFVVVDVVEVAPVEAWEEGEGGELVGVAAVVGERNEVAVVVGVGERNEAVAEAEVFVVELD